MRALVIEDNPLTAKTLFHGLEPSFVVDIAQTLKKAQEKLLLQDYDIALLDIILPDGNGLEFCKRVRRAHPNLPILMLSAKDAVENKVKAFAYGADEYMTKPFSFEELLLRMQLTMQRRPHVSKTQVIQDFSLDHTQRRVFHKGSDVLLSKKEFDIFEYLIKLKGKTVTRALLLDHVWGQESNVSFNTIDAHIKNIRRKLKAKSGSEDIQTIRGVGYTIKDSF